LKDWNTRRALQGFEQLKKNKGIKIQGQNKNISEPNLREEVNKEHEAKRLKNVLLVGEVICFYFMTLIQ
jgi:hypothetical protein